MNTDQVKCPDCNGEYTRLSLWKFCPYCGNRGKEYVKTSTTPYSVKEVAALTGWSRATVSKIFRDVPGVIVLHPEGKHTSIRVPRHVYERVIDSMTVKPDRRTNSKKVYRKRV